MISLPAPNITVCSKRLTKTYHCLSFATSLQAGWVNVLKAPSMKGLPVMSQHLLA